MSYFEPFHNFAPACAVFMRYREECNRGISHTPEWVEKMTDLEKKISQSMDDLKFLNSIDARRSSDRLQGGVE